MNQAFSDLKNVVPDRLVSDFKSEKKSILFGAIEYIKELNSTLEAKPIDEHDENRPLLDSSENFESSCP